MANELIDETSVTPRSPEAPVSPTGEQAPTAESSLPDEVLQIPFLQAIFAGSPAAVSFNVEAAAKTPEAKLIAQNKQALNESGINFYRALSGETGIIFNASKISGEDLIAADKAGKLLEVAPDATKVSADIMASGANHPALSTGAPPGAAAAPTANVPPQSVQMPMTGSSPASRQKLMSQLKNLQPQAPTQGSNPGAGRLLNSILRPVL